MTSARYPAITTVMNSPLVPPHAESLFSVDSAKNGIPAATVIVFGHADERGDAELLFVERSVKMTFAPGAVVFPGGRVDRADQELAIRFAPHLAPDDGAARVAAIRETVEETGLLIGLQGQSDRLAEDLRSELLAGRQFAEWLDEAHCTLDLDRLSLFARWDPRFRQHRAFDTRFYVAALDGEGQGVAPDGTETRAVFWASARRVLAAVRENSRSAIFPTERNLERLVPLTTHEAAVENGRLYGSSTITPMQVEENNEAWLCIPEGTGYPVTRVPIGDISRGQGKSA